MDEFIIAKKYNIIYYHEFSTATPKSEVTCKSHKDINAL